MELHYDTHRAAQALGVSYWTLVKWRRRGVGPKYRRIGQKAVRYRPEDLEAFAAEGEQP